MAQGVSLYVGIAAWQIVSLFWVASGFEFNENCPDDRNAITQKPISVSVLCMNPNLSIQLTRAGDVRAQYEATGLAVGYKREGEFIPLAETKDDFHLSAAEEGVDITDKVEEMKIVFPHDMCPEGERKVPVEVLLKVMVDGNKITGPLTTVQLYCKKPRVGLQIVCPHGVGIKPSNVPTPLKDFCGEQFRVVALIPESSEWPISEWRITQDGDEILRLDEDMKSSTKRHTTIVDLTEAAKSWTLHEPISADAPYANTIKSSIFGVRNGILSARKRLIYTRLCSFDGVDILIEQPHSESNFDERLDVNGETFGNLMSDLNFQIKLADDTEPIPPLVYVKKSGAMELTPFMITAFLTSRPLDKLKCEEEGDAEGDGHLNIQASDRLLCVVSFNTESNLVDVKMQLKNCLEDARVPNICGPRTLVIDVDTIRSMTDEDHCNNVLGVELNFECPESDAGGSASLKVIPNPFEMDGVAVVSRSPYKDIAYRYNTKTGSFKRITDSKQDRLDMHGYGRILVLLKYISTQISTCREDGTPAIDKVRELENQLEDNRQYRDIEREEEEEEEGEENEDIEEEEVELPDEWGKDIDKLLDDMNNLDEEEPENKKDLEDSIQKLMDSLISQTETDDSKKVEQDVLNGIFEAIEENLDKKPPSTDACEVIDKLGGNRDHMTEGSDLAKGIGYLWSNTTLKSDLGCTKRIVAEFIKYKKNPEDGTSYTETCKPRLFHCINKIKQMCHSMDHTGEEVDTDISSGKESVCNKLELSKWLKRRATSLQFFDLRKKMAANYGTGLQTDKCANNRIELKQNDGVIFKVGENGRLKAGKRKFNNEWRWKPIAVDDCDECGDDDDDYMSDDYYTDYTESDYSSDYYDTDDYQEKGSEKGTSHQGTGGNPNKGGTSQHNQGGNQNQGDTSQHNQGGNQNQGGTSQQNQGGNQNQGGTSPHNQDGNQNQGGTSQQNQGGNQNKGGKSQQNQGGNQNQGGTSQQNQGGNQNQGGTSQQNQGGNQNQGGTSQQNQGGNQNQGGTSQQNQGGNQNKGGTSQQHSGGSNQDNDDTSQHSGGGSNNGGTSQNSGSNPNRDDTSQHSGGGSNNGGTSQQRTGSNSDHDLDSGSDGDAG